MDLPDPVPPMMAVVSPGRAVNDTPDERRLLGARILERDVLERHDAVCPAPGALGSGASVTLGRDVEHLVDARGRRRRARQHRRTAP